MMLLGRVIKLALSEQSQFPEDVAAREPDLARRLAAEAKRANSSVAELVADTVGRFMAHEDGESWTKIVGNIQRADDPGYAFISTIMRARLDHRCEQRG